MSSHQLRLCSAQRLAPTGEEVYAPTLPMAGHQTVNGRRLLLFGDGNRLRFVAYPTRRAVYWVSNTLVLGLTNRQMLAIAASLRPIGR